MIPKLLTSSKVTIGYTNVCFQNTKLNDFFTILVQDYEQYQNNPEFMKYLEERKFASSILAPFISSELSVPKPWRKPFHILGLIIEGEPKLDMLKVLLEKGICIHSLGIESDVGEEWLTSLNSTLEGTHTNALEFRNSGIDENRLNEILPTFNCYHGARITNRNQLFVNSESFYNNAVHTNAYTYSKLLLDQRGALYNTVFKDDRITADQVQQAQPSDFSTLFGHSKWYSKKDDTDVCAQCEFRYMCIDKRRPIQRANKEWYFEKECDYNPFIGKWKGDRGYQSLERCGVVSNGSGYISDSERISQVNSEILHA